MLSLCASLNLGDVSLSRFILRPLSWANKSDTVQLAHLRCDLLACLRSAVFKDLKYMISRQSHGFLCNLGITALNPCDYLYKLVFVYVCLQLHVYGLGPKPNRSW